MSNPNQPSAIANKAREARLWVAAVLAGAAALAGASSGAAATAHAESASTGSQPEMVLNFPGTNPYHQSPEELQRIADNLENGCNGVFEPAACVPPGYSTNLLNRAMVTFTPLIPVPGAPEVSFTNDTYTQVPTFIAANPKTS